MQSDNWNQTARKILVVEEDHKLAGVLTDGDIRRWILKNKDISMPVRLIMNTSPVVIKKEKSHRGPGDHERKANRRAAHGK